MNVGLVMLVSQGLQVLIVSLTIGAFFVVFGMLAIDESIRTDWIGYPGDTLFEFDLFGEQLELTTELLRVAGGLAAFSGFYFAISILTDSTYREEFLEELTSEMRETFKRARRVPEAAGDIDVSADAQVLVPGYRARPGQPLRLDRAPQPARLPRGRADRGDGLRPRRGGLLLLRRSRRPVAVALHQRAGREAGGELPRADGSAAAVADRPRPRRVLAARPRRRRRRPPGAAPDRPLLPRSLRQVGPLPGPRRGDRRLRLRRGAPLGHRLRGAPDDEAREPGEGAPLEAADLPARRPHGRPARGRASSTPRCSARRSPPPSPARRRR